MLPKKTRADKKVIEKIFKQSRVLTSPSLTFKFNLGGSSKRISFIVPKTVSKLAVKRNLLRRCGYVALEKHINNTPQGVEGAFLFKKYQNDVLILENEIKDIFNKIN